MDLVRIALAEQVLVWFLLGLLRFENGDERTLRLFERVLAEHRCLTDEEREQVRAIA